MAAKSSDKKNRYFFSKNNIRIDNSLQIIVVQMYCIYYLKNFTFFCRIDDNRPSKKKIVLY